MANVNENQNKNDNDNDNDNNLFNIFNLLTELLLFLLKVLILFLFKNVIDSNCIICFSSKNNLLDCS